MPRGVEEAAPATPRAAQSSMSLCCQVTSAQREGKWKRDSPRHRRGALSHKGFQVSASVQSSKQGPSLPSAQTAALAGGRQVISVV